VVGQSIFFALKGFSLYCFILVGEEDISVSALVALFMGLDSVWILEVGGHHFRGIRNSSSIEQIKLRDSTIILLIAVSKYLRSLFII
jgi:hypothetical protein